MHIVSSVMGHKRIETTAKHYVCAQEKIKKEAVGKLKLGNKRKA